MVKLIDCFLFYNELDMLELRLEELYNVVDKFVLVESIFTFAGKSKELYYWNNKERFSKYNDKIVHIIHTDLPKKENAWNNEFSQRNYILKGLEQISLDDNDLVLIGDCDEIYNSNKLKIIKEIGLNTIANIECDFYYYNLECLSEGKWYFPKILPYGLLKLIGDCNKTRFIKTENKIIDSGWHFSYFGNVKSIINKIKNFSHQEFNNDFFLDEVKLKELIDNNKDIFYRDDMKFRKIKLSENKNLPKNYRILVNNFDYKYDTT